MTPTNAFGSLLGVFRMVTVPRAITRHVVGRSIAHHHRRASHCEIISFDANGRGRQDQEEEARVRDYSVNFKAIKFGFKMTCGVGEPREEKE